MITNAQLHHTILTHLIDHGYAPDFQSLCILLKTTDSEVTSALSALQEYHGIVLHPNSTEVWVIHPFSTAPTNFLVKSARGSWWGNCAWCSLGVAALVKENVTITTSSGAHGERIDIQIEDGQVIEKDLLVHFPIPMQKAWDNVIYTCSTMLVFHSKNEIEHWCKQHRISQGDIQPVSKVWDFARVWYGKHLDLDWKKWTIHEAQQIFLEFELTHPIWKLESSSSRF